jgi:hypothetical protein
VVSAFAGSAPALAALEVAAGPATWRRRWPPSAPTWTWTTGELLSTWDDDPWVEAAYSTRTPAFRPGDPDLLARPVGPLHFAGEHTAGPGPGSWKARCAAASAPPASASGPGRGATL